MKQRIQNLTKAKAALQKLSGTPNLQPDTKQKLDQASQSVDQSLDLLNQYRQPQPAPAPAVSPPPETGQARPSADPSLEPLNPIKPPSPQQLAESGLPMGPEGM